MPTVYLGGAIALVVLGRVPASRLVSETFEIAPRSVVAVIATVDPRDEAWVAHHTLVPILTYSRWCRDDPWPSVTLPLGLTVSGREALHCSALRAGFWVKWSGVPECMGIGGVQGPERVRCPPPPPPSRLLEWCHFLLYVSRVRLEGRTHARGMRPCCMTSLGRRDFPMLFAVGLLYLSLFSVRTPSNGIQWFRVLNSRRWATSGGGRGGDELMGGHHYY